MQNHFMSLFTLLAIFSYIIYSFGFKRGYKKGVDRAMLRLFQEWNKQLKKELKLTPPLEK